jgi:hypothetical protein
VCVGVASDVLARLPPLLDVKSGWVRPVRCTTPLPYCQTYCFSKVCWGARRHAHAHSFLLSQMSSRQETPAAKRDAARRAPQAEAAGAAAAAPALANLDVNVNKGGHWTTQNEDPDVGPNTTPAVRPLRLLRSGHRVYRHPG